MSPLAFLPMMVLWFGIGEPSKVMFIAYAAFFPIFTTTIEGIKYVDPLLIRQHTRSPGSANTWRLFVEEGGFLYDSDAYNDDLPYFVNVAGKRHLVLPYAFDTNDMQFFHTQRFSGAGDFAEYVIDAFDWLHGEGGHQPKMMSIGLRLRIIGRPGRIGALERILRHCADNGDAWIAPRVDIARHWLNRFPSGLEPR